MDEESKTFSQRSTIKPDATLEDVKISVRELYGLKGGSLTQLQGFDDLNFHCRPSISSNPFINNLWPEGYVVKILNSLDSSKEGLCEAQNELLLYLRERDIPCPKPVQTLPGDYYTKQKFPRNEREDSEAKEHMIRVFEFLPGTVLKKAPKSYPLFYKLGIFLAKLDEALKDFSHPFYQNHYSAWHLKAAPGIKSEIKFVKDPRRAELVEGIIEKFVDVLSKAEALETGLIHGDFNENNILLTKREEWEVSAVLDFGDSHHSFYLFELAIAMCYMMFECKRQALDIVVGTGHLLAGYLTLRPTFLVDYALLKICICARICQSLVLGLVTFSFQPENEYVLESQEFGWGILEEFYELSEKQITEIWDSVVQSYNIKRQSNNSLTYF